MLNVVHVIVNPINYLESFPNFGSRIVRSKLNHQRPSWQSWVERNDRVEIFAPVERISKQCLIGRVPKVASGSDQVAGIYVAQ